MEVVMTEFYKDIPEFEGLYQISNLGNVKSLRSNIIMKPRKNNAGYYYIQFSVNQKKTKKFIHRLVAEVFIPNPANKKEVHHLDGNPENNKMTNLKWVEHKDHTDLEHIPRATKPVIQYDLNGNFIKFWNSQSEINRELNYNKGSISNCCNGKTKTAYGFKWQYAKEGIGK